VNIGSQNLEGSLAYISANAASGDDYLIVLGAGEYIAPASLYYSGKNVGITLLGSGGERTVSLPEYYWYWSMFDVGSGVTLTLDRNITLKGRSESTASLVSIYGGSLVMTDGAKITGNNASYSNYGGGGVCVNSGTFTMSGGVISGNTSDYGGGGGVSVGSGTFTMHGGEISGNTATDGGGGVYVDYYNGNGTFTKPGGTITGYASDTANGNAVKDSSGVVQSNKGHAVCVYMDFSPDKRRETSAGPGVNMDSSVSGAEGGWE
jgi:hypothetical protein